MADDIIALHEEFVQYLKESAEFISARAEAQTWQVDSGEERSGFHIEQLNNYSEEKLLGGGQMRETWGHSDLILDLSGELFTFGFAGEESTSNPTAVITKWFSDVSSKTFVGKGKPFTEIRRKIDRLKLNVS